MGASDKTSLPKNCPSAQQFADFFQAKVAAVREATAGGEVATEPVSYTHLTLPTILRV